jgi:hypothetical protein
MGKDEDKRKQFIRKGHIYKELRKKEITNFTRRNKWV